MNFEHFENKYFHISEGNMNIEVSVTSNHVVYGNKIITCESKKLASKFLNELFTQMKNTYDAKKMSKKQAREFINEVLDRVFTK